MSKTCKDCATTKPLDEFPPHKQMRDGRLNKCRACKKAYDLAYKRRRRADGTLRAIEESWKDRNREKVRGYQRESQLRRRTVWRAIIAAAKDQPCADCAVRYPSVCMDFDHVRGEKLFNIGVGRDYSTTSQLEAEIAKCDVRCANCHRLRHARENAQSGHD